VLLEVWIWVCQDCLSEVPEVGIELPTRRIDIETHLSSQLVQGTHLDAGKFLASCIKPSSCDWQR